MDEFKTYLEQTRRCLDSKFYYPALAMALALPDICASLAGIGGKKRERYENWLHANPTYLAVEPEWVWLVRCAFLHDGTATLGDPKFPVKGRVVLFEHPPGSLHHTVWDAAPGGRFGTVTVEVEELVGCLLDAARRWATRNAPLIEQTARNGELLVVRRHSGD